MLIAAAAAASFGSLKKTSPQIVAAITPVTSKSYCSMMEPTMLATATLKICGWLWSATSWVSGKSRPPLHAQPPSVVGATRAGKDRDQSGNGLLRSYLRNTPPGVCLRCGLGLVSAPVDQAACQNHVDLQRSEIVARPHRPMAIKGDGLAVLELAAQIAGTQHVVLMQSAIVGLVDEGQRQDAVVDEVLAVNARKALRQHNPQPQVSRGRCGMFPRRALAVVATSDDGVTCAR